MSSLDSEELLRCARFYSQITRVYVYSYVSNALGNWAYWTFGPIGPLGLLGHGEIKNRLNKASNTTCMMIICHMKGNKELVGRLGL